MIRLIVACTPDFIIGKNGHLPFQLKDDLQFFKEATLNRVVVMGRKTHESIGKALPMRRNVVLSRKVRPIHDCYSFTSVNEVFDFFGSDFDIIGGSEIYKAYLELGVVDEIIMTHISETVKEGVLTRFPAEFLNQFERVEKLAAFDRDDRNQSAFTICRYIRKGL